MNQTVLLLLVRIFILIFGRKYYLILKSTRLTKPTLKKRA